MCQAYSVKPEGLSVDLDPIDFSLLPMVGS